MSNDLYTYAPSKVKVTLFGLPLEGFSKDNIVSIERLDGSVTFRKAMDGSRTGFTDRYGSYRVTISLMQSSPSNTWIHQIYKVFQKLGAEFKIPLSVSDGSNHSDLDTFSGTDVFFEDEPSTNYTNGSETTTWTFVCHDGRYSRVGAIESYDIAEKLKYLFTALDFADSLGFNLEELGDITSSMLDKVNVNLADIF